MLRIWSSSDVRLDLSRILGSFRRISGASIRSKKPLLIDGKKCDLRLYVLLDRRCTQAYDGICVYSSTRVFVRVCVCARETLSPRVQKAKQSVHAAGGYGSLMLPYPTKLCVRERNQA